MDANDLDMLGMNLAEVGTEPTNIVKNCNDKSSGSDDYSYKSAEVGTDCISRQAALDCFRDWIDKHGDIHTPDEMPEYMAIEALPSTQPEQTDCEYCHEDSNGYVRPIEKNGHAFIRFGMNGWELSLKAKGWHGSAKIRYCPMCGRRLIDERFD